MKSFFKKFWDALEPEIFLLIVLVTLIGSTILAISTPAYSSVPESSVPGTSMQGNDRSMEQRFFNCSYTAVPTEEIAQVKVMLNLIDVLNSAGISLENQEELEGFIVYLEGYCNKIPFHSSFEDHAVSPPELELY